MRQVDPSFARGGRDCEGACELQIDPVGDLPGPGVYDGQEGGSKPGHVETGNVGAQRHLARLTRDRHRVQQGSGSLDNQNAIVAQIGYGDYILECGDPVRNRPALKGGSGSPPGRLPGCGLYGRLRD